MEKLHQFYENKLGAIGFYQLLKQKTITSPDFFNPTMVLSRINSNKTDIGPKSLVVSGGDVRIDMPVLSGDVNSKDRILILGLEPRHTNDFYNIMKVDNRVYATPFGIDRWFSDAKQSVYASAFKEFLNEERLFLFSDFVKEYKVEDPDIKSTNDKIARDNFEFLFESKYKSILEREIKIFNPNLIIALGKSDVTRKIPNSWLKEYNVKVISHPTNGNFNRMKTAMREIL